MESDFQGRGRIPEFSADGTAKLVSEQRCGNKDFAGEQLLHSATKTGKRVRNALKTKSPAAKERDEQPPPDVAEATPPGSAKELSSSSGETKKAKEHKTNQTTTAGQQNLDESFARAQGSEL